MVALASKMEWRAAWQLGSLQRLTVWCGLAVAGLFVALYLVGEPDYYSNVLNLLSAISTAGYSVSDMPSNGLLLLIFVTVMVIGGDVGSTAGGLKIARMTTLLRAGRHATREPRLPDNAVAPLREQGHVVKEPQLIALLALIVFYVFFVGALWAAFVAYGYPPLPALFDTVSAFSTVGLSTGVISSELPDGLKAATVVAMWLGRLEFVAVLLLVLPRTWIKLK